MKEATLGVVVGFDREIFLHQIHGGVSRGFASIISELSKDKSLGIEPRLLFSKSSNYYINALNPEIEPSRSFLRSSSGWSTLATYGITREFSSMWAGGKNSNSSFDILHATYYRPLLLDRLAAKKLAVTIHDFIPERLGWTGFRNPHIGKRSLCKKADLIVCVSETTKTETLERYALGGSQVRVIHQGVNLPTNISARTEVGSDPYLLFVGHRTGYKNFNEFLRAFSLVRVRFPDMKLVLVGPELSAVEGQSLNEMAGEGNWCALPPQTDEELQSLYRSAFAHVVASSMEGFGMTILESMAQGTPVIINDIPIFHEVAGNAGNYFSHNSPESFLAAIEYLSLSSNYRRMSQLSIERSLDFSWHRAAVLHAEAYREVLLH
jgi:glycosyltransferase involved in cell wall biosynthesis